MQKNIQYFKGRRFSLNPQQKPAQKKVAAGGDGQKLSKPLNQSE
jgi:hypothetical protein